MSEYDFNNLSSYEFEILSRDLLNEEYRFNIKNNHGILELPKSIIISFSSFKEGKDGGIDLLFEYSNEDKEVIIIGQIKHSKKVDFSSLKYNLSRKKGELSEVDKVKKLHPSKYIFITSIPLSYHNKKSIQELFAPYIISINDIYGREDLNKLLTTHSHVERRHVKLYFNNPLLLERIISNATISRSGFSIEEIKDKVELYVQTSNYQNALEILSKNNVIIIKGPPGVGKTTLAEMLILNYLERKYHFYEIMNLDNEIERLISTQDKAVFYHDDFLGSNYYEINYAKNNESRLLRLIRRINRSSNKILILTTRTTILNKAEFESEKFRRISNKTIKFEFEIDSFSWEEKLEILTNHVNRSDFPEELKKLLLKESSTNLILENKNFSPRLVEFFTDINNINSFDLTDYEEFVYRCLKNPELIWKHSFEFQITKINRAFLGTLFMFGNSISINKFKAAFIERVRLEVANNNYIKNDLEFKECVTTLDGTFIQVNNEHHDSLNSYEDVIIEFANPSIVDFLIHYYRENKEEVKNCIESFTEVEQLNTRFGHSTKIFYRFYNKDELKKILLCERVYQLFIQKDDFEIIELLMILKSYFEFEEIQVFSNYLIEKIKLPELIDEDNLMRLTDFLFEFSNYSMIKTKLNEEWNEIINSFLACCEFQEDLERTILLFDFFDKDFSEYYSDPSGKKIYLTNYERVMKESIEQMIYEKEERILSWDGVEVIREEILAYFLHTSKEEEVIYKIIDSTDWENIIRMNLYKNKL